MDPVKSSPNFTAPDDLFIPPAQRKTMVTLLPNDCRWPIGDPQTAEFHFCGKHKKSGRSYCEFHVGRAITLSRPRAVNYLPRDVT